MKFGKTTGFLVKAILILAISGGLAVAFNTARPEPYTFAELNNPHPPGIGEIVTADLLEGFASGKFFIIDARSDMEFSMGHVPGALNIPSGLEGEGFAVKAAQVSRDLPIVIYCDGLACGKSLTVAKKLLELGFRNVSVYTEGIDGWLGAGMDLEAQ